MVAAPVVVFVVSVTVHVITYIYLIIVCPKLIYLLLVKEYMLTACLNKMFSPLKLPQSVHDQTNGALGWRQRSIGQI